MTGSSAHSCPSKKGDGGRERPQIVNGGFPPKLTSTNRPEIRPRVRRPKWAHRVALPTRVDWAIIGRFNPAPVRGMCRETRWWQISPSPMACMSGARSERPVTCARATSWTALPRRPLRPFPPGQCNGCVRGRRQIGARRPRRSRAALGIELYPAI